MLHAPNIETINMTVVGRVLLFDSEVEISLNCTVLFIEQWEGKWSNGSCTENLAVGGSSHWTKSSCSFLLSH